MIFLSRCCLNSFFDKQRYLKIKRFRNLIEIEIKLYLQKFVLNEGVLKSVLVMELFL